MSLEKLVETWWCTVVGIKVVTYWREYDSVIWANRPVLLSHMFDMRSLVWLCTSRSVFCLESSSLTLHHVCGLVTLLSADNFKLNRLPFLQSPVSGCIFDCREMYKHIATSITWSNEAEAFGCIEPLHLTCDTLTPVMRKEKSKTHTRVSTV